MRHFEIIILAPFVKQFLKLTQLNSYLNTYRYGAFVLMKYISVLVDLAIVQWAVLLRYFQLDIVLVSYYELFFNYCYKPVHWLNQIFRPKAVCFRFLSH
jgi:hypothetical protein